MTEGRAHANEETRTIVDANPYAIERKYNYPISEGEGDKGGEVDKQPPNYAKISCHFGAS